MLIIHWQSVVCSQTKPNIAESVSIPLLTHCAENPLAVCGLLAHKARYCIKCIHAFTDPLCWESTGSLWFARIQGPILQKVYPCLYWPTVLRIHWQVVVCSHTRPNIAESVSMPLLTHCADKPLAVCGLLAHKPQYCRKCIRVFTDPLCWETTGSLWFPCTKGPILHKVYPCLYWPTVLTIHWQSVVCSHTRPNIAESVSMPWLTHCAENPLAVCTLLAHKAKYCRKCIHAFTDPLCWESTGSLWFARTQGPILQKVYPCLDWPTVLRIYWLSVVYSHTRPNIAESVSMPLLTHCADNPLAVCGLLAHKAQYCIKCIHAFTDPLCWESTGSLWFTRTQGPILQKVYPCLYWPTVLRSHWQTVVARTQGPILQKVYPCLCWPTVLRIHWQSVVYSHTRPNIAESVSMPLLTHCAKNALAVCCLLAHKAQYCRKCIHAFTDPLCWESTGSLWFARTQGPILHKVYPCLYWPTVLRIHWQSVVCSHTRPNIAESVSVSLLTHCAENPLAGCGLLAHKAQYCRKCIHTVTDPLCWESTGSLWFTRTQGPILHRVYPCLYWPTVLRIHWQSVVCSHTRPNIAESVSMP